MPLKTQEEINQEFRQTFQSNVGEVTILMQPRHTTPGLRKPYEYELPVADARALVKELKDYLKANGNEGKALQCDLVDTKSVKYGMRLNVFLLGFRPGLTGEPEKGIYQHEWDRIWNGLIAIIKAQLGENVSVYVEPWSDKEKFQLRFETYIKFTEL